MSQPLHVVGGREGAGTLGAPQFPRQAEASAVLGSAWALSGWYLGATQTELFLAGPGEELELSVFEWLWEPVALVLSDWLYPSGGWEGLAGKCLD